MELGPPLRGLAAAATPLFSARRTGSFEVSDGLPLGASASVCRAWSSDFGTRRARTSPFKTFYRDTQDGEAI